MQLIACGLEHPQQMAASELAMRGSFYRQGREKDTCKTFFFSSVLKEMCHLFRLRSTIFERSFPLATARD